MKKKLPIPEFKDIEDEANFWDTHDSEDYQWEEAKDVSFAKDLVSEYDQNASSNKKVIPIRLDDETKNAVEQVAKSKGMGTSTAARMLIRERLIELKIL